MLVIFKDSLAKLVIVIRQFLKRKSKIKCHLVMSYLFLCWISLLILPTKPSFKVVSYLSTQASSLWNAIAQFLSFLQIYLLWDRDDWRRCRKPGHFLIPVTLFASSESNHDLWQGHEVSFLCLIWWPLWCWRSTVLCVHVLRNVQDGLDRIVALTNICFLEKASCELALEHSHLLTSATLHCKILDSCCL